MGQDGSKIPSKRRVKDAEKVKLLSKENRATVKLSATEIQTLKRLYHQLASLSPENEFIDKQTFLNYFPLEGILAERLFAAFDKDRNNVIDYEEFLGGLALCLCGSVDEKFQLIFDLYNIDDGDGISEEELAIVLKSTLMAATAIVSPVRDNLTGEYNQFFDIDKHVKHVVKEAFEECDTSQTGKLSPEDFRTWAERHSYILDIIFGHRSFTDKQKISENITAATIKAAEINSVRCQTQTWVESPSNFDQLSDTTRGYSEAAHLWSPVFPIMLKVPKARSEHTVCVYQGTLYLLGGRGITAYKDFWKYDLVLNNWSEISSDGDRPSQIFGHTAVVHKGSMYIYGGEFTLCETHVWKYTFADNRWQQISPLTPYKKMIPSSRRHHSAVAYENKMFVFGGLIDLRGSSSELWSFNFVDHEWDLISPTPKNYPGSRYGHSAVVYNRAMWILGGLGNHQAKNDLWKWSFGNNSWSKVKTRGGPLPIHGHRVAKCGNAMLIFGGSINGEYRNTIWKFEFEALSWSLITPHGGVSPPARSAPAVVTLSAFSLPLLPPQLVTPKQNSRGDVHQSDIVEELRPHSSPEFQYKEDPRPFESRCRQWSLSTDSLYLQANKNRKDKRCSSGSVDDFGENDVISFTNVSYCSSNDESQFPKRNRHPLQPSLGEKVWSSEDHEVEKGKGDAKNEKRVQWNHDELDCTNNDGTKSKSSELKKQLPHVTEGLCIFLVGGKYYGNHEFFTKGIDIWRCDVTKRQKRSSKVTKIKVQTAGTDLGTAKGASADRTTCAYNENMKTAGMNSRVSANVSPSPMDGSIRTCFQKPFKTSENQNLAVNDDTTTSKAGIYHGDLVITDLGFSDDLHPAKDN